MKSLVLRFQACTRLLCYTHHALKIYRSAGSTCRKDKVCDPPTVDSTVQISELKNGLKVGAGKLNGAAICAVTVLFQVGARDEVDDEWGVTHFLRAGSYFTGRNYYAITKSRYLQQKGSYITCSGDRSTISYTLRCPSFEFNELKNFLMDTGYRSYYPDYDLGDIRDLVRHSLDRRSGEEHVIDLVQKALFGGQLSNSIYCEEERVDSIDACTICEFCESQFTAGRCSVGAFGVPFDEVITFASLLKFSEGGRTNNNDNFRPSFIRKAYETYDKGPGGYTYIAIAVPGICYKDFCNVLAYNIVAASLGTGPMRPYYINDYTPSSPIGDPTDPWTVYSAFSISYADTGVFELGLILNDDNCVRASEGIAWQCAANVDLQGVGQFCQVIDNTPNGMVQQVAQNLAARRSCGEFALAVVGDVEAAPFREELF